MIPSDAADQRLATIEALSEALDDLYNWARVVEKNAALFSLLERRLAGMVAEDAVRGLGYLQRSDVFQPRLV